MVDAGGGSVGMTVASVAPYLTAGCVGVEEGEEVNMAPENVMESAFFKLMYSTRRVLTKTELNRALLNLHLTLTFNRLQGP